jgi:hypothetical protein
MMFSSLFWNLFVYFDEYDTWSNSFLMLVTNRSKCCRWFARAFFFICYLKTPIQASKKNYFRYHIRQSTQISFKIRDSKLSS